jgi:hypothetical protein
VVTSESPDQPHTQSFGGAHRGRVCVRVFIEMNVCIMSVCVLVSV